ncbi:intercellular adhesion molecule 5 isoform X2 [Salvelinus namaycush]|uniref:Intercellular adhesion molecule 5 isoform X2 n=1 Tax=Salvelinus namaycush TaxID=8040 RepID=A0A8U0Q4J1_SALNM|nr:intercellular adhesion molecule 5 isoform X2 [Salvelinus namaycush]
MISLQRMLGLLMLMLLHGVNTFPLELNPPRVVVRYGDSVSVNCSTSSTDHEGMGWEATFGGTGLKQHVNVVTWTVDNLTDWTIEPKCYITSLSDQPSKVLPVILYKTPDSVSISVLSHSGPMVEGTEYQLQCDIQNIAPLQNLVVKWYKGNELLDNVTYSDVSKTPVDVSPTLMIIPSRDDDGAQYRCRAELDLGPEGPQPHPTVTSEPLNITVHYAPEFLLGNDTVVVRADSDVSLDCSAEGNPPPELRWTNNTAEGNANETTVGHLRTLYISRVTANATYNCTVTNRLGSITKQIHVLVDVPPQQHPTMFSTAPSTPGTMTTLPATVKPKVVTFPLELNPPRVVVRYGDSVSVNCSTSSTDHEGMGWEATFGGTSFEQDVNVVTWTVDNLTDWTIEPKCYITLNDGKQSSKVLPVILYKTPDSVSISVLSHSGPMVEGTEYQLQCDIQNIAPQQNLVVKWYKGNELLDNVTYSNVSKTPVDVSATLMISPSRDDDEAQYSCRAELGLGPEGPQPHPTVTSEPLNITVHYKPVIECPSQYSAVKENSPLDRIPCTFNGNPPPNVVWYQEGRQVNASAPLGRTDFGQYVITITNDIGSTSYTVHITVEYAPKFNCIDQYEVKENENHNLSVTCTVDGNPSSKIIWLKAQQEVDIPQSLTRENRGEYTLVTNNTHGKATHKLVINVLYAPEFLLGNDTVEVSAGSDVSLNCSAEGNPPPEMKWNDTAARSVKLSTEGRQRTVRITTAGIYICTATNIFGTVTRRTTVTIKGGSTIIFWVIALVFLVIALVVLKVFCMWKKRQGYYNFIPVNQSNVPLMPLSTTGVDNHDPEGYPTKV